MIRAPLQGAVPMQQNFQFFPCSFYGPKNIFYLELLKYEQLLFSEVISQPFGKRSLFISTPRMFSIY